MGFAVWVALFAAGCRVTSGELADWLGDGDSDSAHSSPDETSIETDASDSVDSEVDDSADDSGDSDSELPDDSDSPVDSDTGASLCDLTLDDLGVPGNGGLPACVTAQLACGDVVRGSNQGGSQHYDRAMYNAWQCASTEASSAQYDAPERVFQLSVPAWTQATVVLNKQCDRNLEMRIIRTNSACPLATDGAPFCERDYSSGTTGDQQVKLISLANAINFEVVIDGRNEALANFELSVACQPSASVVDGDGDGATPAQGDCDDANASVHPAAQETCADGVDSNCDGQDNAEGAAGCTYFWQDSDGDGHGKPGTERCLCEADGAWTATLGGDCYDASALAYPGATAYHATHRGDGSFDYDCNLLHDKEVGATAACTTPSTGCQNGGTYSNCHLARGGWEAFVPECGEAHRLVEMGANSQSTGYGCSCTGGCKVQSQSGAAATQRCR